MGEAYFSRPGNNTILRDKMIIDIKNAKTRILCAMAFITDNEVVNIIKKQDVSDKRFVINSADTNRENSLSAILQTEFSCVSLGTKMHLNEQVTNNMHHKFIIIDDILWFGSYNLTVAAAYNNWESMIRFERETIINSFEKEFEIMWVAGLLVNKKLHIQKCTECGEVVDDPFLHFSISIFTGLEFDPDDDEICHVECNKGKPMQGTTECHRCGETVPYSQTVYFNNTSYHESYCLMCAAKDIISTGDNLDDDYY